MATATDDDIDVEDEVTSGTVELDDLDDLEPAKRGPGWRVVAGSRWRSWSRWERTGAIAGPVVGLWLFAGLVGAVAGGGGDGSSSSDETETTSVTIDPATALNGLPELNPVVASFLRTQDLPSFANHVLQLTADGTSACDLFFGVTLKTDEDGTQRWAWSLNTAANEARKVGRGGTGVQLPSSQWPMPAFYGPPCNVPADDRPLVAPTATAATTPAPATTAVTTTTTAAPVAATTTVTAEG